MTTTEPVPVTYDQLHRIDQAAYERLCTLVVLNQLRDRLLNYGWIQAELWADSDVSYRDSGEGPTCLVGGLVVALGRDDLAQGSELDQLVDHHPATIALDETVRSYPNAGRPEPKQYEVTLMAPNATPETWAAAAPGDRVVRWNDEGGRTVMDVIALIDQTIDRLENE